MSSEHTYRNGTFQLVSLAGAGVIAMLAIVGLALAQVTDAPLPGGWLAADVIFGTLGAIWYGLGFRYALRVDHRNVRVISRWGWRQVKLSEVRSFDPDTSPLRSVRLTGPMLLVTLKDGSAIKARAALPQSPMEQERVLRQLNKLLQRHRDEPDEDEPAAHDTAAQDAAPNGVAVDETAAGGAGGAGGAAQDTPDPDGGRRPTAGSVGEGPDAAG